MLCGGVRRVSFTDTPVADRVSHHSGVFTTARFTRNRVYPTPLESRSLEQTPPETIRTDSRTGKFVFPRAGGHRSLARPVNILLLPKMVRSTVATNGSADGVPNASAEICTQLRPPGCCAHSVLPAAYRSRTKIWTKKTAHLSVYRSITSISSTHLFSTRVRAAHPSYKKSGSKKPLAPGERSRDYRSITSISWPSGSLVNAYRSSHDSGSR